MARGEDIRAERKRDVEEAIVVNDVAIVNLETLVAALNCGAPFLIGADSVSEALLKIRTIDRECGNS